MPELDEIYDSFCEKMTQIHLYQRAMDRISKKELTELFEYKKTAEENDIPENMTSSYHSMVFPVAKDGSYRTIGSQRNSIEDRKNLIFFHKNKQYRWLLAEAYEEFELFLKKVYAYAGYKDTNFWPLSDFGNISLNDLRNQNFSWFIFRTKSIRSLKDLLNRFRKQLPNIQKIENDNYFNINLRFAVILVEHLRHTIVHNSGTVLDKSLFIEKVLKEAGLYNNGSIDSLYLEFINNFFGNDEYENSIVILEVVVDSIPIETRISKFGHLTNFTTSYAHMIYEELKLMHN